LGVIAMRYKTTVAVLQQTNKLSSSNIRTGRHLIIPMSERRGATHKGQVQFTMGGEEEKPKKGKKLIHLVIKGDTWWDLARTYDVGLNQLAAWNGKVPKDTLSLGQKLDVWATRSHLGTSVTKTVNYEIKRGDSLWRISQRFKVSIAQLREWNGLSIRSLLKPGQKLTLYVDV
jgi:membrane-bound lytic murein transglycosylase D